MALKVGLEDAMEALKSMFTDFDDETIYSVLVANKGRMEPTIERLLKMSDENAAPDDGVPNDGNADAGDNEGNANHSSIFREAGGEREPEDYGGDAGGRPEGHVARSVQEKEDARIAYRLQQKYYKRALAEQRQIEAYNQYEQARMDDMVRSSQSAARRNREEEDVEGDYLEEEEEVEERFEEEKKESKPKKADKPKKPKKTFSEKMKSAKESFLSFFRKKKKPAPADQAPAPAPGGQNKNIAPGPANPLPQNLQPAGGARDDDERTRKARAGGQPPASNANELGYNYQAYGDSGNQPLMDNPYRAYNERANLGGLNDISEIRPDANNGNRSMLSAREGFLPESMNNVPRGANPGDPNYEGLDNVNPDEKFDIYTEVNESRYYEDFLKENGDEPQPVRPPEMKNQIDY